MFSDIASTKLCELVVLPDSFYCLVGVVPNNKTHPVRCLKIVILVRSYIHSAHVPKYLGSFRSSFKSLLCNVPQTETVSQNLRKTNAYEAYPCPQTQHHSIADDCWWCSMFIKKIFHSEPSNVSPKIISMVIQLSVESHFQFQLPCGEIFFFSAQFYWDWLTSTSTSTSTFLPSFLVRKTWPDLPI